MKKGTGRKKAAFLLAAVVVVSQTVTGNGLLQVKADKGTEVSTVEKKAYSIEPTYAPTLKPTYAPTLPPTVLPTWSARPMASMAPTSTPMAAEKQETVEVLEISSVADFQAFAERVNQGESFKGKLVKLVNDITFDGVTLDNFKPIGTEKRPFKGIFDGQGHTISGIIMVENIGALFHHLDSAIVRNLNIKECEFNTSKDASVIANQADYSRIQNCQIGDNVVVKGKASAAAVAIQANNCELKNCSVGKNVVLNSEKSTAGIALYVKESNIVSCNNASEVVGENSAAGIIEIARDSMIYDCSNENKVTAKYQSRYSGGIAGGIAGSLTNSTIDGCYNNGVVTGLCYVGGIAGLSENTNILNSVNKGQILGMRAVFFNDGRYNNDIGAYSGYDNYFQIGGIVGIFDGGYLNNCSNQADVEGYGSKKYNDMSGSTKYNHVGGLTGVIGKEDYNSKQTTYIQNCFQSGNVIVKVWNEDKSKETKDGSTSEIIGSINAEKAIINNCHYLLGESSTEEKPDGIAEGVANATIRNLISKTADEMKSEDFLNTMNKNRGNNANWLPWIATDTYPTIKKCNVVMVNDKILGMYAEGTTITFEAAPFSFGYQVTSPVINNGTINYENKGNQTYSFVMPAEFVKVEYEERRFDDIPTASVVPSSTPLYSTGPSIEPSILPSDTIEPSRGPSVSPSYTTEPSIFPSIEPTHGTVPTSNTPQISSAPSTTPVSTPAPIPEPKVEPINQSLVLYAGGNTQNSKTYNIKVNNLTNYELSYESSNPDIAGVSGNGTITAKKAGTASVFVVVKDKDTGKSYSFVLVDVTVKKASLSFAQKISTLKIGKSVTVKVRKNGIKGTVKWSVSNKKYASINNKGILKAKKAGTVKVTAACGKQKATMTVKIKK